MNGGKETHAADGAARKDGTWEALQEYVDAVKEDMADVEVTAFDEDDRTKWRRQIR